jgi:diguanylate cyclase (GGDEF)-like protein/PAS domain S-box-containing protein
MLCGHRIKEDDEMKKLKDKKSISIRNSIVIIFMVSVVVSVVVIGLTVFTSWMSSVHRTTRVIAQDMNHEINQDISHLLQIPYDIIELNEKVLSYGILDFNDDEKLNHFFTGVLESQIDEIYSFSYGTEDGDYYGARRLEEQAIEIMKNDSNTGGRTWYYKLNADNTLSGKILEAEDFDPRTLEWYINAKKAHGPVYSPIYKHYLANDLTVSASWPIYDDKGDMKGVLGAHMLLSGLDAKLTQIVKEKQGYAFVIEKDTEELIANSMGFENFTILEDGSLKRNKVSDILDKTILKGYDQFKSNFKENFMLKDDDDSYFVTVEEYRDNGLNWYIVSAVPYSLFMEDIKINIFNTVIILILATIISVIIYFIITHKLFRPIDTLIETMSKLSAGDLTQRVPISRNDEIGKISAIFNQTAEVMNDLVNHLEASVEERTADLMEANEALQQTKEDLYLILDSTAEGIFGLDIDGNCSFCNNRCIELLGYHHQHDLIGKNMHSMIHHSSVDSASLGYDGCKIMNTLRTGESAFVDNEVFWKADGCFLDVEYYSYPQLKDGILSGAVVTFTDATERRRNEEQIRYLSCHDALTGLLNRGCFERTLKQYDTKSNLPITIMFADLNGLKLVNDVFGHSSGDLLIKKAAEVLKKTCRNEDILARVGGDEFIVLLPRTEPKDAKKIIERVEKELSKERVNGLSCSMALGFDTKSSFYDDIEKVMSSAESEMYHVKMLMKKSFGNDTINTIMNSLQQRSDQERVHSENIARLCEQMGWEMKLSDPDIKKLRDAGYMHDIGKIVLTDEILNNMHELSEYETQMKRQHPVVGYRLLNLFDDTLDLADVVYAHHERFDGTGYPKGLKGDEIPLISRIITLAEYYERLVTRELVLGNLEWEDVYQKIRNGAGTSFDPDLVESFIRMLREYENKK